MTGEFILNRPFEHQFPVPGTLQSKHRYPWLVYLHGERRQNQTFCDISSYSCPISRCIPEFRDRRVLYCSPDGNWLLLLQKKNQIGSKQCFFLWSPSRGESIKLPPLRQDLQRNTIHQGLVSSSSSTLTDPNPHLVLMFLTEIPLILYCHVGDPIWREFNYTQSIEVQAGSPVGRDYYLCSPVIFNGKIYATASREMDLVQIGIDDNNNCEIHILMPVDREIHLSWRSHPRFHLDLNHKSFLVSRDGCDLFLILMFPGTFSKYPGPQKIFIFKFDFSKNLWRRTKTFDGGAVFLCSSYSVYSSREGASLWSYIYFTSEVDGQTLFSYRVEDDKVTSYLLEPWLSHWIMPTLTVNDGQQCGAHDSVPVCGMADEQQADVNGCVPISGMVDSPIELKPKNTADFLNSKCGRKRNKREKTSLSELSSEVLGLIVGQLSLVDYMHFRCVSKHCASGTIRMRMNPFPSSLLYWDKLHDVYHIVDSNLNRKLTIEIPDVLKRYEISSSRYGWLLLKSQVHSAFFNPLTMQVVPAGRKPGTAGYGILNSTFIGKPTSSDCLILSMLQFTTRGKTCFVKHFPEPGKAEWRAFAVGKQGLRRGFLPGGNSPVFVGDNCYYLGDNRILGRVQLTKNGAPSFRWKALEDLVFPTNSSKNYLTECGGELLSVLVGDDNERDKSWVRVFKLKDEKKWEEMDSLGGYCLYLSSPSSISCLAERPEVANRIYFPMFYKDALVYYSLNTKSYHAVGSQNELQRFNETSSYLECAWIEPNWK